MPCLRPKGYFGTGYGAAHVRGKQYLNIKYFATDFGKTAGTRQVPATLGLQWVFADKIRQSGIETRLTSNLTPAMEMAHNRRLLGHPLDSQRQLWFSSVQD